MFILSNLWVGSVTEKSVWLHSSKQCVCKYVIICVYIYIYVCVCVLAFKWFA